MLTFIMIYIAIGLAWVVFTESKGAGHDGLSRVLGVVLWPIEVAMSIYMTIKLNSGDFD